MSKYFGSPWGYMRGKLFDTVGGYWKGINWNRVLVFPTQRGTLDLYRMLKDGLIPPEQFSYAQMNIRRAVLQVLGHIGRMNLSVWIYPVWEKLVAKRGWTMTGINAFVRRNAATLLNSMPHKEEEFDATNEPDLTKMLVSDGDLEGATLGITTAEYTAGTGTLVITWDPTTYTNGTADDYAYIIVAKKPILESIGRDGTWYPKLFLYPFLPAPSLLMPAKRADGTVSVSLPQDLDPADLTAYLFFRDPTNIIGNSPSAGFQVVAAGP